jgi:hypothetical protein
VAVIDTAQPILEGDPGPAPVLDRIRHWPHAGPLVVVLCVVLVANALFLFGVFDPNPLNLYAGLSDLTRPGLTGGLPAADPNVGITSQALGHLAALDWLHGHVPWWNPYEGLGAPLAGEMQSASFFPPTLLLAFSNGQIAFHLMLEIGAGAATYALLIRLGVTRSAAVAGAVAFALGGTFAWFGHAPVNPLPFLPLMLLGVELATDAAAPVRRRGFVALSIGVALSLYAGFPEDAYLDGLLVAIWAGARLAEIAPRRRATFVAAVLAAVVTGLLLAAPVLTAFLDYLRVGDVGGHAGAFAHASLPAAAAPQVFLPYVYGPINPFADSIGTAQLAALWKDVGGYLTVSLLPLASLGAAGAWKGRRSAPGDPGFPWLRVALLLWLLVAFGRTFGIEPFVSLVDSLPGMKDVAFSRYSPPTWTMALTVMAVLGFDDLVRGRTTRIWVLGAGGLSLFVVAASIVGSRRLDRISSAVSHLHLWEWGSALWAVLVVVVVLIVALRLGKGVSGPVLAGIVVVDALAMFVVPELAAPRAAVVYPAPVEYLATHLGSARFVTVGPVPANYGSYFALSSINSNDIPQPKAYDKFSATELGLPTQSGQATEPALADFLAHVPAFEEAGVKFLLAPHGVVVPSQVVSAQLRPVLASPSGDLFELPHPSNTMTLSLPGCRVVSQSLDAATVACPHPATLLRRETFMPGWSASVDGKRVALRAAGPFQVTRVPSGTSTVTFSFSPPFLTLALVAFGLGLLAVVAVCAQPCLTRRRRAAPEP